MRVPSCAGKVAVVDATGISEELLGRNIPNTAMLGAFAKISGLVDKDVLFQEVEASFGAANREAAQKAYRQAAGLKE